TLGYGWVTTATPIDRGAPNTLLEDFHTGNATNTFNVTLPGGTWYVNVVLGDNSNATGPITVSAEGTPKLSGNATTTASGSFIHRTFSTSVSDGTLNLAFTSGFAID